MMSTLTTVANKSTQMAAATMSTPSLTINDLDVIQNMIDCSADRLEGLRTQCVTSATLTQREIRSLETKLLRMFSELLLTKSHLNERLPASGLPHTSGNELKQWLRVVGLSQESLNVCLTRLSSLEQLLELCDEDLKELLTHNPKYREEEVRRFVKAMQNLRTCRDLLNQQNMKSSSDSNSNLTKNLLPPAKEGGEHIIEQLYWDSWDRPQHHRGSVGNIGVAVSPRAHRMISKYASKQYQHSAANGHTASTDNLKSKTISNTPAYTRRGEDDCFNTQGSALTLHLSSPIRLYSSSQNTTAAINVNNLSSGSLNSTPQRVRMPNSTPMYMEKNFTTFNSNQSLITSQNNAVHQKGTTASDHIPIPLSKSKSNDSQIFDSSLLSTSTVVGSTSSMSTHLLKNYSSTANPRTRLNTDPSPDSHSSLSSEIFVESSNSSNNNSLQIPLSPCTPIVNLGMSHSIAHRFNTVFKMTTCDLCQKSMFLGRKCKECNYRCHKLCEPDVPPSCCLPPEFIDEFKNAIKDQVGYHSTLQHTPTTINTHTTFQSNGYNNTNKGRTNPSLAKQQKQHGSTASSHVGSNSPTSSCNSSCPSSPALFHVQQQNSQQLQPQQPHCQHVSSSDGSAYAHNGVIMNTSSDNCSKTITPSQNCTSQFNFPDVTKGGTNNAHLNASSIQAANSSQNINHSPSAHECTEYNAKKLYNAVSDTLTSSSETVSQTLPTFCKVQTSTCVTVTTNTSNSSSNNSTGNIGPSALFQRKIYMGTIDKRTPFAELSDTHKSNDSDKTVSLSGSISASTDSDRTPVRLDSTEDGDSGNWPRQNSMSLKEWDIPYGDLQMLEKIGQGRFGTVHHALWHGSVAVKLFKEDYLDDVRMLEAFKLEVANFKKTRHENLVLFMGACMNPPYLAIVTSLCKGNTLYTHIHARREKFVINKTTLIAQQITQGMGYLHARGITHKDLRTKNIFLENGKVIITDFGLFSSTKLMYGEKGLGIPNSWLCYIAPELMRCLMPCKPSDEILPFSAASDVYSFGTVWYELLCGEFPFKSQPPESVIWQVGRGMKQTLANLQTSRDVKDILMLCWHYTADDRPDFRKLLTLFERLPKKRLARSPSHPVQLSRSAEAIF